MAKRYNVNLKEKEILRKKKRISHSFLIEKSAGVNRTINFINRAGHDVTSSITF